MGSEVNKSSVEAGLTLCKEIGAIDDWKYNGSQHRYALIKGSSYGYLDEADVLLFNSPTDLSDVVKRIFGGVEESEKKAKTEIMVKYKLNKLLKKIENNTTKDKGLVGVEWVRGVGHIHFNVELSRFKSYLTR